MQTRAGTLSNLLLWGLLCAGLMSGCSTYRPNLAECLPCFAARRSPSSAGIPYECRNCFEIRTRYPFQTSDPLSADLHQQYFEEYAYIRSRRRQSLVLPLSHDDEPRDHPTTAPPPNLIGVALSGGGIRSASFALGAMQAMEKSDLLSQVDYMGAVSGGAYLAGWMQAHLGSRSVIERDRDEYEVHANTARGLLDNDGDHVSHLRTHTGHLNDGSWFPLSKLLFQWLIRWPAHVVMDDILHWRAVSSWQHVIDIYRGRIESTYLRGKPHDHAGAPAIWNTRLVDINDPDRAALTPYTILNGNLAFGGQSRVGTTFSPDAKCADQHTQWNFEFTRDFVGSDATGYVDSRAFDRPIERVRKDMKGHPAAVVVSPSNDVSDFRLSEAVAASGAAFDSVAVAYQVDIPVLTEFGQLIAAGLLNLHLGVEAQNFARKYDGWSQIWDYTRMVTYQRMSRFTDADARWLYITDGGHYENLGVLSLLRRGTQCVVAFDATADSAHGFDDLHTLLDRLECDLGLRATIDPPLHLGEDGQARYTLRVFKPNEPHKTRAKILYVKANASPNLPHLTARPDSEKMRAASALRLERDIARVRNAHLELIRRFTKLAHGLDVPPDYADISKQITDEYDELESLLRAEQVESGQHEEQEDVLRDELNKKEAEVIALEQSLESGQLATKFLTETQQLYEIDAIAPEAAAARAEPAAPMDPEAMGTRDQFEQKITEIAQANEARRAQWQRAVVELDELRYAYRRLRIAEQACDAAVEKYLVLLDTVDAILNRIAPSPQPPEIESAKSGARKRFEERLSKLRREAGAWDQLENQRNERIAKVLAYDVHDRDFPHTSTLKQRYDWERFEAYRELGYQEASTYLSRLVPVPDPELKWCTFAPDEITAPAQPD